MVLLVLTVELWPSVGHPLAVCWSSAGHCICKASNFHTQAHQKSVLLSWWLFAIFCASLSAERPFLQIPPAAASLPMKTQDSRARGPGCPAFSWEGTRRQAVSAGTDALRKAMHRKLQKATSSKALIFDVPACENWKLYKCNGRQTTSKRPADDQQMATTLPSIPEEPSIHRLLRRRTASRILQNLIVLCGKRAGFVKVWQTKRQASGRQMANKRQQLYHQYQQNHSIPSSSAEEDDA